LFCSQTFSSWFHINAVNPILCLCRNKKNDFKEFKRKGNGNRRRKQPKELQ
jgi:hypothetical protein